MLTDTQLRNLKPKEILYRKADSNGLAIEVTPNGSKLWRHRYRYKGKAKMISLGNYPNVSLLDARQARDNNKQLLKDGINPKKAQSLSENKPTFKDMFDRWFATKFDEWKPKYAENVSQRASNYLFPIIGNTAIEDIDAPEMRHLLLKIQDKGVLDMLQKVKGIANGVFSFSVGMGVISINPVRDLPSDIFKKKADNHYATITDPKEIGKLLDKLEQYNGSFEVNSALKLASHVFLRPSELTGLLWSEVDFDDRLIRINAERMKMKRVHVIPLSKQVLTILKSLAKYDQGSNYVFPTPRNNNKSITPAAIRVAIRNLGVTKDEFTTHGFRHMASTRLNELGYRGDLIEIQLAHVQSNKVRAAYNHAEHLDERIKMMQEWSDYLDKLQNKTITSPSELQQPLF
jgi:integrase